MDPFESFHNGELKYQTCRIYGDDKASIWSVVDEEDYQFLLRWRWSPKWSKCGKKYYLRRNLQIGTRESRTQKTLFLHTVIMWRTGIVPPGEDYTLVDHLDGDGMNCRRSNLRWANHSMNCRNKFGRDVKNGSLDI